MPFEVDVVCSCGQKRTVWFTKYSGDIYPDDIKCPNCGGETFTRCCGSHFGSFQSSDLERRSEILKKRSEEHSMKHFKENYDRVRSKILKK